MSRIHEALKKAEQERSGAQPPEALSLPIELPGFAEAARDEETTSPVGDALPRNAAIVPPIGDYLRFDDLRTRCTHPTWHPDPNVNVFFSSDPAAHGAEQFRTLRSRLYQLRANQTLRKILITSSVPAEGKTFVANNLAQAIVRQPDRRVLIIDADLRRPRLHVPLGAPLAPGLTDFLRGDVDAMGVIQHCLAENLCLIPGGNEVKDPSELLSNGRLKALLDRVTPVFDWVIIDSPPCLPVADANILADFCDGVLMVVRAGSTPSEVAQRACQEMQGRNIIGVVLNFVQESSGYASYYYPAYTSANQKTT